MATPLIASPIQLSQPAVAHTPSERTSDEELMVRVRRGDESALGDLLERYWKSLVQYAISFLGDIDAAEDAVQEAYVRLWARRSRWVSRGSPRSYLYRTVKNLVLQELEKRSVRRRWRESEAADQVVWVSIVDDTDEDLLRSEIDSAIQKLPPRRQEILVLTRFHGMSYAQVAEVMEISRQTVANQLSAALRDLREALAPYRQR